MVNEPAVSLAAKPVPVTAIAVPLGPEVVERLTVGEPAADAYESSGVAMEIIRRAVRIATVNLLYLLYLLILYFLQYD